jgi:hypothetical protein
MELPYLAKITSLVIFVRILIALPTLFPTISTLVILHGVATRSLMQHSPTVKTWRVDLGRCLWCSDWIGRFDIMVATLWFFALPALFPSCVSIAASWRVTLGTLHYGETSTRKIEETTMQATTESCLLTYRSLLTNNSKPTEEKLKVKNRERLPGFEDDHALRVTR